MQNQTVDTATAVTVAELEKAPRDIAGRDSAPSAPDASDNRATMTLEMDGKSFPVPMEYAGTVTIAGDEIGILVFDTENLDIRTITEAALVDTGKRSRLAFIRKNHAEQDKADLFTEYARRKGCPLRNPIPDYTEKHGIIDLLAASQPMRKEGTRYHPWSESSLTEPHGKMLEALRLWERAQEEPELLRQLITWEHLQTAVSLTGEHLADFMDGSAGNSNGELAAAIEAVRAFFFAFEKDEQRDANKTGEFWAATAPRQAEMVAEMMQGGTTDAD